MHDLSKLTGFIVISLLSSNGVSAERPDTNMSPLHSPSCYTRVEASTTDADDFFVAGEADAGRDQSMVSIEADSALYSRDGKLHLEGNVLMHQTGYRAQSQTATVDQSNGEAELVGDIRLDSPNMQIQGESARVNMSANEATVQQAKFLNPQTRLRGEARLIRQQDEDLVVLEDGMFTTCAQEDNAWSFRASEITLGQERGYGEAYHSRFEVLDVPVLYIPYFRFPIDNRRKSGFLYPTIGSSNTGEGLFFSAPYYLNLAPDFDATITPSYIGGRGIHSEVELRHLTRFSHTELGFGYLDRDDSFLGEQQYLGNQRESGERWGLSFEQDYDFSKQNLNLYGRVDYSEISDNDYLDDLNQGLRIENNDHLDRRANFFYASSNWQLEFLAQEYKNLDDDLASSDEAYLRLPEINYQAFFYHEDLELDWQTQYVYFYRDPDDLAAPDRAYGSRIRHFPKLSLPWEKSWGYLKPSVGIDHTDYALSAYTPTENHISRTVPVYELDTGLYFDRESRLFGNQYLQSLEPRLYYVYSAYKDQSEIPNFDASLPSFSYQRLYQPSRFSGADRIADNNRVTLGFTSRWTDWSTGIDRLVLRAGRVFNFEHLRVDADGLGASDEKESFWLSEVLYRPLPELELSFAGAWDARSRATRESISKLAYRAKEGGAVLNLSHRYRDDGLEQANASAILPLNASTSLLGRWRYDIDSERTIGTLTGIEYNSCCWRVQVLVQQYLTDESTIDNGILFRFQLVGLGGLGADQDSLDEHIPGYKAREEYFQ